MLNESVKELSFFFFNATLLFCCHFAIKPRLYIIIHIMNHRNVQYHMIFLSYHPPHYIFLAENYLTL